MDTIRNETIRTEMGMKRDITGNRRTAIAMVRPLHAIGRLQNCYTGCRMEPTGEKEAQQIGQYMDSKQRRNLKDEEYFDRELWRIKIMSLSWRKLRMYSQNNTYICCHVLGVCVTCKTGFRSKTEFTEPLYNLLQHFTSRDHRLDTLDF
jgi:hypothetical protein